MAQFHETQYGKRFFDSQLPKLIKALERIADALEKQNKEEKKQEAKSMKVHKAKKRPMTLFDKLLQESIKSTNKNTKQNMTVKEYMFVKN